MEVRGHLLTLTTVPPLERTPVPIKWEAGKDSEAVWKFLSNQKSLSPTRNQTVDCPASNLVVLWLKIDWISLAVDGLIIVNSFIMNGTIAIPQ